MSRRSCNSEAIEAKKGNPKWEGGKVEEKTGKGEERKWEPLRGLRSNRGQGTQSPRKPEKC